MTVRDAIRSLLFEAGMPGGYYEVPQDEASAIAKLLIAYSQVCPASEIEIQRISEGITDEKARESVFP